MDRRAFFGTVAGGLLAAPLGAKAQEARKVYHVGFLWESPTVFPGAVEAFHAPEWFDPVPHTHVALDDAIEQGQLFCNMLKANVGA